MNPEEMLIWSREPTGQPFDTRAWNRFMNFMNGVQAGRFQWRTLDETVLLAGFPELPLLRSHVEFELQVAGNGYEPGVRHGLRVGARDGTQASRDAAILIENENDGAAYRWEYGILFGDDHPAVDATAGTLIGAEDIEALNGLDWSGVTFATTGRIFRFPGISPNPDFSLLPVNGAAGLRLAGDFTNATRASRLAFVTGTTNGFTFISTLPNGTGTLSGIAAYNAADPDAAQLEAALAATATAMQIRANRPNGATAYLPIRFFTSDLQRLEIAADGTVTIAVAMRLGNGIWLVGRNSTDTADLNLIRANSSNQVEIGGATVPLSLLSPLVNNAPIRFRNAGGTGTINAIGVNASDQVVLGDASADLNQQSPYPNNTPVPARNAGGTGTVSLIGVGADDHVKLGNAGQITDLLGTTLAPGTNPPADNAQITSQGLAKALYAATVVAGTKTDQVAYNVASCTRNLAGDYTVAWDRDFASAFYVVTVTTEGALRIPVVNSKVAGSADIYFYTTGGVKSDPDAFYVAAYGTLS